MGCWTRQLTQNIVKNAVKLARLGMWVGLAVVIGACGNVATPPAAVTLTNTSSLTQSPGLEPSGKAGPKLASAGTATATTATASPSSTPIPNAQTIAIWWPAPLAPENKADVKVTLQDQITRYEAEHTAMTVTLRIKRANGLGGIPDALVSGSVVAPSAMPDLTLMRREDLANAVAGKLIHPIDVQSLGIDDFFASGLLLGKIGDIQYGIPYALEVQHLVYRVSALPNPPASLDDLLNAGQPFLFPANTIKSVSMTLLTQYVAAGGRVVSESGAPILDHDPLLAVLKFYEQAVNAKVVTPQLLDFTTIGQYWPQFVSGKAGIVQTDSTLFLSQQDSLSNVSFVPLLPLAASSAPAEKAGPASIIDGWMWVLTTSDPDRQARALNILKWLLEASQQGDLSQKIGILPSRQSALDDWGSNAYLTFARSLLDQVSAPPADTINPIVASQLQNAFEDVLLGRKSSESAADDAVAQVTRLATAQ